MDFSSIISSVDYSTVVTAMIGVGAAMALPLVARTGVRLVLSIFSR